MKTALLTIATVLILLTSCKKEEVYPTKSYMVVEIYLREFPTGTFTQVHNEWEKNIKEPEIEIFINDRKERFALQHNVTGYTIYMVEL